MRQPPLSDFDPAQLSAIQEARESGSALFKKGGITYIIVQKMAQSVVMARDKDGNDVGYISTSGQGKHYAIEVPSEFRGKGIGTTLLRTKEALDGILSHDWLGMYSRILFLIKRGYIPTKKVNDLSGIRSDEEISQPEFDMLIRRLQAHVHEKLLGDSTEDVSPIIFRLNYFPEKARAFVVQYDLQ